MLKNFSSIYSSDRPVIAVAIGDFLLFILTFSIKQVRRGTRVSNEEILGFAKLFNDELTLDNISRLLPQNLICTHKT